MHDIRAALKRAHPSDLPKIYFYIHWVSLKRKVKRKLYIHAYLFRKHYRREIAQVLLIFFVAAPLFGLDQCQFTEYFTMVFSALTAATARRFIH